MILLIKVVFIYLILLISPEEQKIQTFNMPGDKSNLYMIAGLVNSVFSTKYVSKII